LDEVAIDLTFDHNYDVELRTDLPGGVGQRDIIYFPGPGVGADGVMVMVKPQEGDIWSGMFAFGQLSSPGVSGVFACPADKTLCVVSRGKVYLIQADDPTKWESVAMEPILAVRTLPNEQLIVFANDYRLMAYDSNGMAWDAWRLVDDELTICSIDSGVIRCTGWDGPTGSAVKVEVEAKTGRIITRRRA
jgi:hypothetical protein